MIKRIWHGYTTPDRAEDYERVLRSEVMKEIEGKHIAGLRRFEVLRRTLQDETEFVTIMEFETLDDVKVFAGEDYEASYVPEAARAVLKRFDNRSQHYQLLDARSYG
jgi:hypothetical protein